MGVADWVLERCRTGFLGSRPRFLLNSPSILAVILFCFLSILLSTILGEGSQGEGEDFLSLIQLARQEQANGSYQKSLDLYKICLGLVSEKNEEYKYECYYGLGIVSWNLGNISDSKDFFLKSELTATKSHNSGQANRPHAAIRILDLYQSGKAARLKENYNQSTEDFKQAIKLAAEIQCPELELKCLRLLSLTYWEVSDFAEFYNLNRKALEIAEAINHNRERGRCLNNIGAYYAKYDNYGSALASYEKALSIATQGGYKDDMAASLLNLGGTWSDLGNFDKSLEYLRKGLELFEQSGDRSSIAADLNNIGIAMRLRGLSKDHQADLEEAAANFSHSLELSKEVGDRNLQVQVLNNLGAVHADLRRFDQALAYFRQAATIAEHNHNSSYLGMVYNNIGIIYSSLGKYREAAEYYDRAIEFSSTYKDGTFVWETYFELANTARKQADFDSAIKYYENSIASIESIRSRIKTEDLKASYLGTDKRLEAYQNLIDLLATLHKTAPARGYDKEAFNYLERAKARAFLDGLEVAQVDISEGVSPALANRERELMRDIARSYNKLLAAGVSSEDKDAIFDQIKASEDKLESLKREIRTTSPAYADLKYPQVITYDEVRQRLVSPRTVFFAYAIGKQASHGFAISPQGLRVFDVPPRAALQEQVTAYRKVISDRQNRDFQLGQELFRELVAPGLDPGLKKLIFVPDDILNLLPFETLLTSPQPGSWLIRDHSIGYAPSLSSLLVLMQRHGNGSRPRKDLLAIGNPVYGFGDDGKRSASDSPMFYDLSSGSGISLPALKYSGLEIENVSRLFRRGKVTLLEKENATERWLRSNSLADYKIIHFAAHSVIDDKKPARSAIVLSYPKNHAGSGLLQTRNIYNLKLNADLVTLSACQTGLGQFIRGEGIEGLSRAFFYAGSSSVLMSLWSVNDQATYLLMERFYRRLKGGESLMEALRNAQLEMIRSRSLSHPYYWAGFVLNGRTDARVFPSPQASTVVLIILLCLGTLIAFMTVMRRRKTS